MPTIERRVAQELSVELRQGESEGRVIQGYASVSETPTVIWYFEEIVARGAFARALEELSQGKQDVRSLFNHDANYVLGRTARGGKPGTLILREDSKGLWTETTPPDLGKSPQADSVVESIRRGDVSGMSFAFTVKKQEWEFFDSPDQMDRRTITEIGDLYDIGPVTYPAYEQTSVGLRIKGDAQKEHDEAKVRWVERSKSRIVVPKEFEAYLCEMRSGDAWVTQDPALVSRNEDKTLEANKDEETKEESAPVEAAPAESKVEEAVPAKAEEGDDGQGEPAPAVEPDAEPIEQVSSDVACESEARSRQIALKRKIARVSATTRASLR